ncbi:glycosyltransferase family 4 protein [Paraburkholderia sp. ZP32-5]|uniref:glycosyltransferase family 4 protein n=1 Tax=Paraburkholderia sp. ZP32-5 TaxID=2883245 RepID=UPI001F263280|nr:glycosyltransferase family 4 protein [Paraburkholderia sp. ZP32-5]
MLNLGPKKTKTGWLGEYRHPSPGELFCLPSAIYFLMKFRADLARFNSKALNDRVTLYFWWEMSARDTYPDFDWVLRREDLEYLRQLDNDTLIERHPDAVTYWLGSTRPSVLDAKHLSETLLEPDTVLEEAGLQLPKLMTMIVRNRGDLTRAFNLNTLTGYLNCLDWWDEHGQITCPRVTWRPPIAWTTLMEPIDAPDSSAMPFPRFLALITTERPDLRAAFDLASFTSRVTALSWWEDHGQREYPRIKWSQPPIGGFMLEPEVPPADGGPYVPRFLCEIFKERADLQATFDLHSLNGRLSCLSWWIEHGQHQYRSIRWVPPTTPAQMFEPEWGTHPDWLPVPRFLRMLHDERRDMQELCSLDSFTGRLKCLSWWVESGEPQYPALHWTIPPLPDELFNMQAGEQGVLPLLPRFLLLIWNERPDLQASFNLNSFSARLGFISWWDKHGHDEYSAIKWSPTHLAEELARIDDQQPADATLLPRFLMMIASDRPDLREAYDLATAAGRDQLVNWWNEWASTEYPLVGSLKVRWADSAEVADSADDDTDDDEREPARYHARVEGGGYGFGVNVIGFPQGVLGLGEDARMAARVLQMSSTPVTLLNAPMAGPAKLEHSVDHLISEELKYNISLICLPAPEMVRLAIEGGRHLIDAPTHKIGAWPWELPHWPDAFGNVHQMVDEIWAQSRFVQSVYSRLGNTPVYRMPMAVEVPAPVEPKRERFGLPANEFLFYLMFDGNSWLSRKNPLAGVQAFKQAFGASSPGVGLVIKAMNVRDDDPVWRAVLDLTAGDSRIHIVSERLSRQDSTDFMACCDAYISLHRSEGFGRVIAEAMVLGQPVVVTNFSGNVDFCEADTAFLVDGELIPLRPGDYLFAEGQYWCDPEVSIAAEQLKRMIDDAPLRERIAQAGKARIERDYSVQAVARAYAQRLTDIAEAKAK